jgi:alginate O-acetyltransferase complex protein AlgJ
MKSKADASTRLMAFNTVLFLGLMLAGLAAVAYRLLHDQAWPAMTDAAWRNGEITRQLDRRVAAAAPSSEEVDGLLNGVLLRLTGDRGPQTRLGCPGWLFLAEEILEVKQGDANLAQRAQLAHALADDLRQRGIALVTLPVPDKVAQARAQSCGLAVAAQARARADVWRQVSGPLALNQVDLLPDWPAPGYWRTDTHWDRIGARFAAERVAESVRPLAGPSDAKVTLAVADRMQPRPGDLLHLAGLTAQTAALFGLPPDQERPAYSEVDSGGGLLDVAPAPDVLLAGSSYSLNSGFIDYLQYALLRPVAQQSLQGGGFAGALLDALKHHPQRLQGVKVVIWEWPLRSLTQPLSPAERDYLQAQRP